jgi:hypothetical protein
MMGETLTIVVNLQTNAASQYVADEFDSVVEFAGNAVFFGAAGVFEEAGDTDDGAYIDAWVETPVRDFGKNNQKSIAAYSIGFEADGDVSLTLYGDEDVARARTFVLSPPLPDQVQQDITRPLPKYAYGKARYWNVRFANVDGSDFSLDYVELAPVTLQRRRF